MFRSDRPGEAQSASAGIASKYPGSQSKTGLEWPLWANISASRLDFPHTHLADIFSLLIRFYTAPKLQDCERKVAGKTVEPEQATRSEAIPSQAHASENTQSSSQLSRSLTLWDNVFFGIGSILGAGIYAIVGEVAGYSGSLLWLSLLIAAVTALLTACCYGELVSMFPDSGGGYEYIAQGLGRRFANAMSIVLFLTGVVSPAAIALAFGEYFGRLWDVDTFWSASGVIAAMALVNILGARNSSWVNILATLITLAGLALVVTASIPYVGSKSLIETADRGWEGVIAGAALAFFSYVGFEDVVKLAEETNQPRINTPWALIISGVVAMIVYVLVAIAAVSVIHWQTLSQSSGPLSAVMESTWGNLGRTLICVVALFATSKSILSNLMSNSRLLFDLARDTMLPNWLGYLLPVFKSPIVAIALIGTATWLFSLIGSLGTVASISNLCVLSLFLTVNISLLSIRVTRPELRPNFRLPLNLYNISALNVLAILSLMLLLIFNIVNLL